MGEKHIKNGFLKMAAATLSASAGNTVRNRTLMPLSQTGVDEEKRLRQQEALGQPSSEMLQSRNGLSWR